MARSVGALLVTLALFAGAFALHIVGGATDQGWLFALAVALIFGTAAGFPAIAAALAGRLDAVTLTGGGLAGVGLTSGALWAANGRAWEWWTVPLAVLLVLAVSSLLWLAWRMRDVRSGPLSSRKAA